jgi:hypothetical protein
MRRPASVNPPGCRAWLWGRLGTIMVLAWGSVVQAQTFRLSCELQGTIPALEDRKLKPATVTVEMQSIGKNIFIKLIGPRYYDMKVSSLTTEAFNGSNLTSAGVIGARARENDTGRVTEIRIERDTILLTGHSDIDFRGKVLRMNLEGPCAMR